MLKTIFTFLFILSISQLIAQTAQWVNVGPIDFPEKTIGQVHGIGRVSQMKFHPTDPNKMYCASASGGLWMSNNKGVNWTSLGTDQIMNVQSASIAIDPTDDNIIYWCTGDRNYYGNGKGVYKTTDGGQTWNAANTGMGDRLVLDVLFMPGDHLTLISATNNGIYKSTDGGANWSLKTASGINFYDIVFKPGSNGQTIYAAAAKAFYRSTDAGNTWSQISSNAFVMGGSGSRIAVCPASPNVVYFSNIGANTVVEMYKSTDGGSTFVATRSETTKLLGGYDETSSGQGNYDFEFEVNPDNVNELYICAHVIWRSTNGGSTWTKQQSSWAYDLHTDQHHIVFDPWVNGQLWNCNDGGVWNNNNNGTGAWTAMSDGIAATEIYHATSSNVNKHLSSIGTQDNGGFYYSNGKWYNNSGGDLTARLWFDYSSSYRYHDEEGTRKLLPSGSSQDLNLPFTPSNAARNFFAFTPANTSIGYVANGGVIYRCSNLTSATPAWTQIATYGGTIKDMEVDKGNAAIVYYITDSRAVYRSDNATSTASFTQVSTVGSYGSTGFFLAPVKGTSVVYASVGTSLFRSSNKGATWTDVSSGFPAATVTGLVADNSKTDESVYASYAMGVYYKNSTNAWMNYSHGLPIISDITDLFIFNDTNDQGFIRVSYYGRGMWETPAVGNYDNINLAITAPTNNATFSAPTDIDIAVTATAKTGSITKVEFYYESTLLGTDNTTPFTYKWVDAPIGKYALTATAFDHTGASKSIDIPVNITIELVCSKMTGTPFGTSPAWGGGTSTFDKVFDGDLNTFFDYANANGGYCGLDLGTAKRVYAIRYAARSGWNYRVTNGIFQGSNDGTWKTGVINLYTITQDPTDGWNEIPITNTTAFRYYRFYSADGGYVNLAEMELCGQLNNAPVVAITSPANNAIYATSPAAITFEATATDSDGTITGVDFFNGSTLIGSDNTSPYSFNWQDVTDGSYSITAVGYDNIGKSGTSAPITVIVGNQKPIVSITTPTSNSSFAQPATIDIAATASDPDGTISKVEFYHGTTLIGTATASPYTFAWTNVLIGTYQLKAIAYDNKNASTTSAVVTVVVENQKPTVILLTPANNAEYTSPATVTMNAIASDVEGTIAKVEFYQGTTLLATVSAAPYTYTWNNPASGNYDITAKAYDEMNAVTTSTVASITIGSGCATTAWDAGTTYLGDAGLGTGKGEIVSYNGKQWQAMWWTQNNQPGTNAVWKDLGVCVSSSNAEPVVSISNPADNALIKEGQDVTVTMTATDADGTIANVKLYMGTTLLTTDVASPYTYSIAGLAIGTYELIAVATDNKGMASTSSIVTFIIDPLTTEITTDTRESAVIIYPNPSCGLFTFNIQGQTEQQGSYAIYDQTGQLVYSKQLFIAEQTKEEVFLPSLAQGNYFLRISLKDQVLTEQLVIVAKPAIINEKNKIKKKRK